MGCCRDKNQDVYIHQKKLKIKMGIVNGDKKGGVP